MPEARPMRADAARNRARILEAANRQIIARGPEVPMEAVAEDAGVAVGTLYRHFPTKTELVQAVLEAHLEEMTREAEAAADRIDAGSRALDELITFARMVMETGASNKAVKAAARALGTDYEKAGDRHRGVRAMERLIETGKAAGDLRSDLTIDDFYLFFATVPIDQPQRVRDRWFTLMIDGFRAAPRGAERV
ncbi:TetR/AcrR family transcriptional regulator [Glycomyces tenuis]|uniref:TetR/AcrR family transcriptional regulator n=1 Tax=Glycomyces tenuis TaxID=58116 RepID=UPI000402BAB8|nr:TetR/AcrR family transcriptional regulator [Glycomyces tenuis]